MLQRSLWRPLVAVLTLLALLVQGTSALAGTTGTVSGVLTDSTSGAPIAGAKVTAASPSQAATTTTDNAGHYTFLTLLPDTYTLSFQKAGYATGTQSGVTVQADQQLVVNFNSAHALQEIGRTVARSANSLIRPGQTASEYSITPAQQAAAAPLGGGANLNSAYSAISSVPGVVVPVSGTGWGQSIFIRGGDYTQTGNEVDGIPINRAFDQYASGALSSLGDQEIQVYTGNAPADAQAVGLAGFVNQVIRTGTNPGTKNITLGIGTPAQYEHASFEFGGATPSRSISYYLGTGGYTQQLRYVNQYNGGGYLAQSGFGSAYNYIASGCGGPHPSAGCYQNVSPFLGLPLAPNGYAIADKIWGGGFAPVQRDRETIANVHVGIPHKRDGNRDDVQVLYDYGAVAGHSNASMDDWNQYLGNVVNGSANGVSFVTDPLGNPTCPAAAVGGTFAGVPTTCLGPVTPFYRDPNQYTGPVNAKLTPGLIGSVRNVAFSDSPSGRPIGGPVDFARQDGETNEFAIFKAQYQHNIADRGYVRLYGYTLYSNRLDNAINSFYQSFVSAAASPDYTVSSHTRGIVLNGGYQITPAHLLNFNVGYVTSNSDRWRNDIATLGSPQSQVAYLLNSNNPTQGCYNGAGLPALCGSAGAAGYVLPNGLPPLNAPPGPLMPKNPTSPTLGTENAITCGTGPCQYYAINDGRQGAHNTVTPKFLNAAIGDTWKPTPRLSLDLSLRSDTFSYEMQDSNTLGNRLFVNDYNNSHCVNGTVVRTRGLGAACPSGFTPTNLTASSANLTYADILQPRVGLTYSLGTTDVLRASYGRFVQPPETSSVDATNVQAGTPSAAFYANFGFNSFARPLVPEISYNADMSWEHQFRNSDLSMRLSPFYRRTQNEFATVLVDPRTNFVAFINGQNRIASGFELAVNKGDFSRDGFAAQLAYTYTYATLHYKVFPNGGSFVNGINAAIQQYNGYTSFCGTNPGDPRCASGPTAPVAARCYAAGTPDPTCALPGALANPYFNAAPQALFDPNASYFPYNQQPGFGTNSVSTSYIIPHVASLVVQYKKGPWRFSPSVQFQAGSRYGSPIAVGGVAPDTCAALAGTSAATDPRYTGTGASAGAGYDASSCTGIVNIPDPTTGKFDGIGGFVQPNLLTTNLQVSYDITKRITLQVTGANLYSICWGGSNVPWAIGGRIGCSYAAGQSVGNFYNPGDVIQNGFQFPYAPLFFSATQAFATQALTPTQVYFTVKLRL